MAEPIVMEPRRDVREELRRKLEAAPTEHAEALLATLEILQGLHDRGMLEAVRGAVGARDELLDAVLEASKSPEVVRGVRNMVILARTMGDVDPDTLKQFAQALPRALEAAKKAEPVGLWGMLAMLRRQGMQRGLAMVGSMLDELGRLR